MAVGGQDVVPLVDVVEELVDVRVAGRRAFAQVQAHVLERGAPLGLHEDLVGALDQTAVEAGVVDEVLGAGERRPVGGAAGAQTAGAGRPGPVLPGVGDPGRADVRGVRAERLLQGARTAALATDAVGGEDGAVGTQGEAALDAVVEAQGGGADALQQAAPDLRGTAGQGERQLQGAVRAVQAQADQGVVGAAARGDGGTGGAVAAVLGAGPAQERGSAAAREAVAAGEHHHQVVDHPAEQHRAPPGEFGVLVDVREDPVVLLEDVEVPRADRAEDRAPAPLPVVHAHPVQGRDRLRRHQDRVRPGRVLVVAGREGEALLGDELPAVRLVPGDHQQPQQARPVRQPERRRALLGEQGRDLVADLLAGPEGPRVVVDQDVRLAGLLQPAGDRVQGVGGEGVVAVQEDQVVAGGLRDTGVARGPQPLVLGKVHGTYALVAGRELVDDRAARVRRAVVDGDQFEIGIRLREH